MKFKAACIFLSHLVLTLPILAEEIRFDSARDWNTWNLPRGIIEVSPSGRVAPVSVRRDIDAVANLAAFGGGIHEVGSNPRDAATVINGDSATGWSPDPQDPSDTWYLDLDLGRGVFATRVILHFTADAPPFALFDLLLSTGEPQIDLSNTSFNEVLTFRTQHRFKENDEHRVVFELDQSEHTPIRYLRVKNLLPVEGAHLAKIEVQAFGDNLTLNLLDRSGSINIEIGKNTDDDVPLGNAIQLADGDFFTRFRYGRAVRSPEDVWGEITVDLGAVYWIDWIRMVSGIVPRPTNTRGATVGSIGDRILSLRRFDFNLYEVLTSDGSLSPNGSFIWDRKFLDRRSTLNNQQGFADHSFESTPTRFLRVNWLIWDANCAGDCGAASGIIEELMVYGFGFPRDAQFASGLIDLGANKNVTALRWNADTPPGTALEIRSRSGDALDLSITHHDKNNKVVTATRYEKLIPSFRGKIDTTLSAGADWSAWSKIYSTSGETFLSPSPRRYMELDVRLTSDDPTAGAALEFLAIDFSDPLAEDVFGEISPAEVEPGVESEFSYFLQAGSAPQGFDRIALEAPGPLRFVEALIDNEPVPVEPTTADNRLGLQFPRLIRSSELVELRFTTTVFRQSTRFTAFLESDDIRQRVDPGNANPLIANDSDIVRLPVRNKLLTNLRLSSQIITPNDDGVNDQLHLSVNLVNVLEPRPLRLRLYDLSGRIAFEQQTFTRAGEHALSWDGSDGNGHLTVPGIYIAEVFIDGDAHQQSLRRTISVAY